MAKIRRSALPMPAQGRPGWHLTRSARLAPPRAAGAASCGRRRLVRPAPPRAAGAALCGRRHAPRVAPMPGRSDLDRDLVDLGRRMPGELVDLHDGLFRRARRETEDLAGDRIEPGVL